MDREKLEAIMDREDLVFLAKGLAIFVGVAVPFIFGLAFLCTVGERWACASVGRTTGRETVYSMISGCYIDAGGGQMVPLKNWRVQ